MELWDLEGRSLLRGSFFRFRLRRIFRFRLPGFFPFDLRSIQIPISLPAFRAAVLFRAIGSFAGFVAFRRLLGRRTPLPGRGKVFVANGAALEAFHPGYMPRALQPDEPEQIAGEKIEFGLHDLRSVFHGQKIRVRIPSWRNHSNSDAISPRTGIAVSSESSSS